MQTCRFDERTLTELDHVRLTKLLERHARDADSLAVTLPAIADVLDAAELVPSRGVSPDVVTMYSLIEVADHGGGERRRLTLCYPDDAEPAAGFVSVLSPVGAALIGRRVGSTARWTLPDGRESTEEILAIRFQPEASGDYTL